MLRAVDRCDLFVLCWSTHAAQSEWVSKEWQRALERGAERGPPAIVPVYANGASPALPPDALAHLPFMTVDVLDGTD